MATKVPCQTHIQSQYNGEGEGGDEMTHEEHTAPASGEMRVSFRGEDTEDIVVFVHRLAVVAAFLLVPPVTIPLTVH